MLNAIRQFDRAAHPVTIAGVAALAGVDRSYTYDHPDLLDQIRQQRDTTRVKLAPRPVAERSTLASLQARLTSGFRCWAQSHEGGESLQDLPARAAARLNWFCSAPAAAPSDHSTGRDSMSVAVREFERRDRDHLTAPVNLHVAAVLPGIVLSVNAVLAQLEREPDETVVDPWVAERRCVVAERDAEIVAAALLHRFRGEEDVPPGYCNTGEIRWLICKTDALHAGEELLREALARMANWRATRIGARLRAPRARLLRRPRQSAAHPRPTHRRRLRRSEKDRSRARRPLR